MSPKKEPTLKESKYYRECNCCANCSNCENVAYTDDWGTQHYLHCPVIKNNVSSGGLCDEYKPGVPKEDVRSVEW